MAKPAKPEKGKTAATNRRAGIRYEILETLEAGISLTGPEVKSLRGGSAVIEDAFVRIEPDGAYLWNAHIPPYAYGSQHVEQVPARRRRLLMHRAEMNRWFGRLTIKGLTIIPLEIYFNARGKAKVKIALAKGRNAPDERDAIRRKETQKELRRSFGERQRV